MARTTGWVRLPGKGGQSGGQPLAHLIRHGPELGRPAQGNRFGEPDADSDTRPVTHRHRPSA